MYKTKDIPLKELKTVTIANQEEIRSLTGSELDLVKAWQTIRKASDDFSKADLKAQKADELLYQILYPTKEKETPETTNISETIRIQEKERARALALLELELILAA